MNDQVLYGSKVLAPGVRSRLIETGNGCTLHVLESGFEAAGRPCVLLLHGFPEIAFSWRRQLPALAEAGFHVVAPDLRGYGRSSGTDVGFGDDLTPYTFISRVADTLALVRALGCSTVHAVVGHDYGSPVAAWCALLRPDVFRAVVLMSAPFAGPPGLAISDSPPANTALRSDSVPQSLAQLPRPRAHYQWYYATEAANADMWRCAQGLHDFLRAYFHVKSGDWLGNRPFRLASWAATELAKMPDYYIMDAGRNMAETVVPEMPDPARISACDWLPETELSVYASEYMRTGFQGGLQGYRVGTDPKYLTELRAFTGRTIDVPAMYVAGDRDWGSYQAPGALEAMTNGICTSMTGVHFVEGAGHWVQQEAAAKVNSLLVDFLQNRAHRG